MEADRNFPSLSKPANSYQRTVLHLSWGDSTSDHEFRLAFCATDEMDARLAGCTDARLDRWIDGWNEGVCASLLSCQPRVLNQRISDCTSVRARGEKLEILLPGSLAGIALASSYETHRFNRVDGSIQRRGLKRHTGCSVFGDEPIDFPSVP